jgi:hypothetical protein
MGRSRPSVFALSEDTSGPYFIADYFSLQTSSSATVTGDTKTASARLRSSVLDTEHDFEATHGYAFLFTRLDALTTSRDSTDSYVVSQPPWYPMRGSP